MAQALTLYATEHAPTVKAPERIGYAIPPLVAFWGELPVSAITPATCRAYGRQRVKVIRRDPETRLPVETAPASPGTIRKELGILAAAIAWCAENGRLVNAPKVHLPEKPEPRDRWLTRAEAARLIRTAWRNPEWRHVARFVLVALYTGTRKAAVLRLRFMANTSGGHVDTAAGMLYRRARGQAETKKRQPPIRVAPRLLAHLRRWERLGARWVVSFRGQGVASIKTAWARIVAEAGLSDVTPHTLRHTAITWAMQTGAVSIHEAAGYFGVTPDTLQRVYAHHHPDHQQDAVAAVGRGGRKL